MRATIIAMDKGRPGKAYNVGTGISTTFNDILNIVSEEMGYGGKPEYIQNPLKSYQAFTRADTRRAMSELGFQAAYDRRTGIRKTLERLM